MERAVWDPDSAWKRYCGFLDLPLDQFTDIQNQLLQEQFALVADSTVTQRLSPTRLTGSIDDFRRSFPLTSYSDYAELFANQDDEVLPVKPKHWMYTAQGAGDEKWIPFTGRAFDRLLDNIMASMLLSAADVPGDVRVGPGDTVMYNIPPRPYLCGYAALGMRERFGLVGVLEPEVAEELDFKERISAEFEQALNNRVDIMISMTSVLLKVGERLDGSLAPSSDPSNGERKRDLNFRALRRLIWAKFKSKLSGRAVRPRDLWHPRAIVGWGLGTGSSQDRIEGYWGKPAFEIYASTEGGVMGLQPMDRNGLVFSPHAAYFEFLPEDRVQENEPGNEPKTVLLQEVTPGATYEVVISNYYGMPLMRYRTGHLIRFLENTGVAANAQPRFEVIGRSDQRIDIAGFTRIDEKTVWEALNAIGDPFSDWTARREQVSGDPVLMFYAEPKKPVDQDELTDRFHQALLDADPLYRDLDGMLGIRPLKLKLLESGTFDNYYELMKSSGASLTECRPPRMNASDAIIQSLVGDSEVADSGIGQIAA
ncbi:MAG: GH3 auxin-responsive promoter family protein [Chloroflexi bacterium]|nr:GH3 auxin-responsive promoter family protein [Chloroflexota bacterium]